MLMIHDSGSGAALVAAVYGDIDDMFYWQAPAMDCTLTVQQVLE